ncbi:hypothetical protein Y1Q_0013429 [Alligator mississippiensis]|uniref:Uncharacterized protein n=1 Tax=Alligator mississippiensis TaxID=8496 RepID=A0A151MS96_ALLMI|nr:hypothetical protein Y1Q_0013429 [Alligator mississippiensis]
MRDVSCTFIQLKPAGDVIGNHGPAGIKRTTGEGGGGERAEPGKTPMLDAPRDIPWEREPSGAVCSSRGQLDNRVEESGEALGAGKGSSAGGTGELEEAVYTIEVGSIGDTRKVEEALPLGCTRREQ